jgi:hypothetical protein
MKQLDNTIKKYFKPARNPEAIRGYFSYITESVIELGNVYAGNLNKDVKVYFDLENIPGYVKSNMYDVCFLQDTLDYHNNIQEYTNIEKLVSYISTVSPYDNKTWDIGYREYTEQIIRKNFVLNDELLNKFESRKLEINLDKTIGVHRRSTDIGMHHYQIIPNETIFQNIESFDFDNVFLLCDNLNDFNVFKSRYGNKLISYDEFTTSTNSSLPFHKINVINEDLKKTHIEEIVLGALILGLTNKLICCHSNLTNFSILSNSKLEYKILN